jgi:hypothetical protein
MLKFQIFCGMTLVYIAADISCFFITRVVFRNILLIVRLTYLIDFVNTYVLDFFFLNINEDNPIIIGKTNESNYNIMTSWSIMFYNINFFLFFEKIAQVTNLLYDDKNWTKYTHLIMELA